MQSFKLELVAAMIPGELVDLLHHLLLHCRANIWHAIKNTNQFDYNLQVAINLNDYQYETVLLLVGFLLKEEIYYALADNL